jgi:hypothetical protein
MLLALLPYSSASAQAAAPTSLVATPVSTTKISLTWSAPASGSVPIQNYRVFRGTAASNQSQVATVAQPAYTDASRSPATTYYYGVETANSSGNVSLMSALVSANTPAPPAAAANLVATPTSTSTIGLTWSTADSGGLPVQYYHVFRGSSAANLSPVAVVTQTSYTDTSVKPAGTYYYAVQAADTGADLSPMSAIVPATVPTNMATPQDFGARCDGTSDDTPYVQRALTSGANVVYFPQCAGYVITGPLYVPPSVERIYGSGSPIIQKTMHTKLLVIRNHDGLEIDHLTFTGVAAIGPYNSNDTAITINSSSLPPSIGDNAHMSIHDNHFLAWQGGAALVWFTSGLRFEANTCDMDATCLQAYNNADIHVRRNIVTGTSNTSFTSMISINSVGVGGGVPTAPQYHNNNCDVSDNSIAGNSYGEDILVHDCSGGVIANNVHTGYRLAIVVGPAANFNQVVENIAVIGNSGSGGVGGNPSNVGNRFINVSGDNTALPVWTPHMVYTPTGIGTAQCRTTISCVVPTIDAVSEVQATRFAVTQCAVPCTSGNHEPQWCTTPGCTVSDGAITWTNYGHTRADTILVVGNHADRNGYQEPLEVNAAYTLGGNTRGIVFADNSATNAYGVGLWIAASNGTMNSQLGIVGNTFIEQMLNAQQNMRRCIYFQDGAKAEGVIQTNYCNDADQGFFLYQSQGDLSKVWIPSMSNIFGPDVLCPLYTQSGDLQRMPMASAGPQPSAVNNVVFSGRPAFDLRANVQQLSLVGDVPSSSTINATPGQMIVFDICQDHVGGHEFEWPPNTIGAVPIATGSGTCTVESFITDGIRLVGTSARF